MHRVGLPEEAGGARDFGFDHDRCFVAEDETGALRADLGHAGRDLAIFPAKEFELGAEGQFSETKIHKNPIFNHGLHG